MSNRNATDASFMFCPTSRTNPYPYSFEPSVTEPSVTEPSVTMVHKLRCPTPEELRSRRRVVRTITVVTLLSLTTAISAVAQEPGVHYWHQGVMPPGAIGSGQLQRGGPLHGFFQPVQIKAPTGALVSLADSGSFDEPQKAPVRVGMLIGQVYRVRVMGIPRNPGMKVFPTIEIIDRLYTPRDQMNRFAIPVELTLADLELALQGKFVTRVIYLENPNDALPVPDDPSAQDWFEAAPGQDPLAMADALGRPVAILRLGGRLPDHATGPDEQFLYGCPPVVKYARREAAVVPSPAVPIAPVVEDRRP